MLLSLKVAQQGTVAAHNAQLTVAVTVRNQTADAVYLANHFCEPPVIHVNVQDSASDEIWQNWTGLTGCPKGSGCPTAQYGNTRTGPMVAAGSAYAWSTAGDLSHSFGIPWLQANRTYSVLAAVGWQAIPCPFPTDATTPPQFYMTMAQASVTLT